MTGTQRTMISISTLAIILIGLTVYAFLFLLPQLRETRVVIDNDRAATILIEQQRSNLDQLSQDLQAITTKQSELEQSVWSFATEDTFFTYLTSVTAKNKVSLGTPVVADATPTGSILSRAITIPLEGSLSNVLAVVADIQSHNPLIAIGNLEIAPGDTSSTVAATLTGSTLWK